MSNRRAAGLAWGLCALTVLLALAGPVVASRSGIVLASADMGRLVVSGLTAVVFGIVGALIVSRQPRNTIGWLLLVVGPSFAFSTTVLDSWSQSLPAAPAPTAVNFLLLWVSSWTWWLLIGPLLLIPMLFPTGRLLSPRWRWVVALLAASFTAFLLAATFARTFTWPNGTEPVLSPVGFLPDAVAQIFFGLFEVSLPLSAALSVAAILVRYRRAVGMERAQMKWLLLACAVFGADFILQFFAAPNSGANNSITVLALLFAFSIPLIPIAIGIAILRYRLWDIDILIRRTLIYSVLTGLLALAYFGSVIVLQNTFGALTGQGQGQSPLVTVLSTLLIAALFVPLRRGVQSVIDRRFYRRKYDAARTLAAFGVTLRDEVELAALTERLLGVVDDTMQPASVGLWLRGGKTK